MITPYSELQNTYPNDNIDISKHVDAIMAKIVSKMKVGNYKGTTITYKCDNHTKLTLVENVLKTNMFKCQILYDCKCFFARSNCRTCRTYGILITL